MMDMDATACGKLVLFMVDANDIPPMTPTVTSPPTHRVEFQPYNDELTRFIYLSPSPDRIQELAQNEGCDI